MPYGIITNCSIVAIGGLVGVILKNYFPAKICDYLSKLFGITSITIGMTLIVKIDSLSAVMLALILGAILGEWFFLEEKLKNAFMKLQPVVQKLSFEKEKQNYNTEKLIGVIVLMCTGSTGLMGAMTEGMTGDTTILIAKSVLDFFGGAIFASTLGIVVALIAVPQFIIYITLFALAQFIIPFTSTGMIADFMACGGIIAFVTGLRIAEIKSMNVTSLLPALILVMPISYIFSII